MKHNFTRLAAVVLLFALLLTSAMAGGVAPPNPLIDEPVLTDVEPALGTPSPVSPAAFTEHEHTFELAGHPTWFISWNAECPGQDIDHSQSWFYESWDNASTFAYWAWLGYNNYICEHVAQ